MSIKTKTLKEIALSALGWAAIAACAHYMANPPYKTINKSHSYRTVNYQQEKTDSR